MTNPLVTYGGVGLIIFFAAFYVAHTFTMHQADEEIEKMSRDFGAVIYRYAFRVENLEERVATCEEALNLTVDDEEPLTITANIKGANVRWE